MLQMEKKLKLTAEFLAKWQMIPIIWLKKKLGSDTDSALTVNTF